MPLVEGTVISAGADGQAEIEFEDGSLARITPNSGLSLVNLSVDSSGTYQTRIALLGGLSYLELRAGTKYVYSVDAGGDIISPIENATIRVKFRRAAGGSCGAGRVGACFGSRRRRCGCGSRTDGPQ